MTKDEKLSGSGPNGCKIFWSASQPLGWIQLSMTRIFTRVQRKVALKEIDVCCSVPFPSMMCHCYISCTHYVVSPSWDLLNIRLAVRVCVCNWEREEVRTWMCFQYEKSWNPTVWVSKNIYATTDRRTFVWGCVRYSRCLCVCVWACAQSGKGSRRDKTHSQTHTYIRKWKCSSVSYLIKWVNIEFFIPVRIIKCNKTRAAWY